MATTKRPKAPTFKSFKGTFVYPKLNEPDTKFKKDGEFALKLRGRESDPDVQALINLLQPLYDSALARGDVAFKALPVKDRKAFEAKGIKSAVANPLFSVVYDEETEEPTGDIEFKFATPAYGKVTKGKNAGKEWVRRPAIFDVTGACLVKGMDFHFLNADEDKDTLLAKAGPAIWGGTVGKVNFEVGTDAEGEPGYFVPGTAAVGLSLRLRAVQIIDLVSSGESDYGFGNEAGEDEGAPFDKAEADF